jgi:sugar porter (SP) family MFS transporter
LYIAEVVPAQHRGRLVTYSEIALNIGIVFGFATGLIFAPMTDNIEWRCMLAFGTILPVIMIILLWTGVMPESPRWLISSNRCSDARIILLDIYPPGYDIDHIVHDISESIRLEQIAERNIVGWNFIVRPSPAIRRMMFVGVAMAVAQQAVGIDAIQYYLTDVIDRLGIPSDTFQSSIILILLGSLKLAMIVVGGRLFDQFGRRPLLLISLIGMSVALLAISIIFLFEKSSMSSITNIMVLIGLALYLAFFSIGIGPCGWLIPSEVFSMSIRGKAMSIATFCNRVAATLMSSTFLSTVGLIGWSGFFFMLFLICLVSIIFVYFYVPETKDQSLERMTFYFASITNDLEFLDAEARMIANSRCASGIFNQPTGTNTALESYHRVSSDKISNCVAELDCTCR